MSLLSFGLAAFVNIFKSLSQQGCIYLIKNKANSVLVTVRYCEGAMRRGMNYK